jgi:hypothetical protein
MCIALRVSRSVSFVAIAMAAALARGAIVSAQTRDPPPPRLPATGPGQVQMGIRDGRPPVPKTGTGVVRGRVVDGVTGRPISRVRVRLTGDANKGPILTDGDGGFEFTALPPGVFSIATDKSTYLPARHPEASRSIRARMSMFPLAAGQQLDDLSIPMFHSGAIAGRVVDAHGDPIESAQVMVMTVQRGGRPQQRGGGTTNDLGEFRVSRLQPGRYVVRVRAQQMFATDPLSTDKALPQPLPVYYPSALSPDEAQIVVVNRGETITGIDVIMAEGIPTTLSGIVISPDGQGFTGGSVAFRMVSSIPAGGFDGGGTGIRPDGSFRVHIPPGEYQVEARAQAGKAPISMPRPETMLFGSIRVVVSGETMEGVTIPIGTGATAAGRIIFEGKSPPAAPANEVRLPLFNPEGPGCEGSARATIAPDWSFKAEGLMGTCAAQPDATFGGWRLKALMVGDENLTGQTMTFQPGQHYGNVRVIATDKLTSVEFQVADESGQPTREYAVIVFSTDKTKWTQMGRGIRWQSPPPVRSDQITPLPGRPPAEVLNRAAVRMQSLPIGDYYAIAVDDLEQEDVFDPGTLEKLVSSAVKFSLSETAPLEVPLRRVKAADVIR